MFGTDNPAQSNNYHRGLFHGRSHGQRRQRCFSMKYSIQTMKPNVMRKTLYSDVLGMSFRLFISTKARKCMIKCGNFDNYLTMTNPRYLDSRLGMYLRSLVLRKQKDPKFVVPYVPGQAQLPRHHRTKNWEYRNMPAIYMPMHAKQTEDMTLFYKKTPQEMSRIELKELEHELRTIDDAHKADFGEFDPETADPKEEGYADKMAKHKLQLEFKEQVRQLLPIRNATLKRYFDKFKMQKKKRDEFMEAALESEKEIEQVMGNDYVHFMDVYPEIRQFMEEHERKEAIKLEAKQAREGTKIAQLVDLKSFGKQYK